MPVTAGDTISSLALLLSIYATWRAHWFRSRELELMELQKKVAALAIERERHTATPDLMATFVALGGSKNRLRISNRGQATAYEVTIEFPEAGPIIESEVRDKFPLEALERGQSVDLTAAITMGTNRKLPVRLTWQDGAAEDYEKVVHVTL